MEKCHIPVAYYRINDKGVSPAEIFFGLDHKNDKYHFFIENCKIKCNKF